MTTTQFVIEPGAHTNASAYGFAYYAPPGDSALTASTEAPENYFNLAVTRQHATGTLALQRDFLIFGSTDSFVGASTENIGATLGLTQKDCGANGTCVEIAGLYIPTYAYTGSVTTGVGIDVTAPSAAASNYAAILRGNVNVATGNLQVAGLTTPGIVSNSSAGILATSALSTNLSFASNTLKAAGTLVNMQVFTSSGTYTPTAGANHVIVMMEASGGGGGGSGNAGVTTGGTGGTTSYGAVVSCTGGLGGGFDNASGGGGGACTGGALNQTGGTGGAAIASTAVVGATGGVGMFGGAGYGGQITGPGAAGAANTGAGGGGAGASSLGIGAGGGAGGQAWYYGAATTQTITIGAAGTAGAAGTGGATGGAGGIGVIIVLEFT
jgi:hypothetical protein